VHESARVPTADALSRRARAVPFDGNYLSHSPFMLNAAHSKPGNMTVGLQCGVPLGVSAAPQEVAGYDLTLGFNAAGAVTSFTYTINPDAQYPNGWSQPATNYAASNTMFSVFVAVTITAASCTFSDAGNTAIVGGYPTLYFPCALVVVPLSSNLSTSASLLAAPRGVLLYTQTASAASAALPAIGSSFALDGGAAVVQGCASWPCSAAAPFGGASATVLEASTAPNIKLIPQGCAGVSCTAVNGNIPAPFANCPAGQVTALTLKTGNAPAAAAAASPASAMSTGAIVAWLSALTAVFGFFFVGQCALALHARITRVAAGRADSRVGSSKAEQTAEGAETPRGAAVLAETADAPDAAV